MYENAIIDAISVWSEGNESFGASVTSGVIEKVWKGLGSKIKVPIVFNRINPKNRDRIVSRNAFLSFMEPKKKAARQRKNIPKIT